ncbi:MAG: hypothetical protein GKS06_05740 [Acidobacteria bacterium]|nr:hypothetical protein [Acidobacteriota bacterium]
MTATEIRRSFTHPALVAATCLSAVAATAQTGSLTIAVEVAARGEVEIGGREGSGSIEAPENDPETRIDLDCEPGSSFQITVRDDSGQQVTLVACGTGGFVLPDPAPGAAVTVHL